VIAEPLCQTFQSQNGFCGQGRDALLGSRGVNPRRRGMSFVGLAWSGTDQGKQKCLMYATNFVSRAFEESDLHKTAHLHTKSLAQKRSGFKMMTNECNIH
jgi:hypothetical protein